MNIRTYCLLFIPLLLLLCYTSTIAQNKYVATELIVQTNSPQSLPTSTSESEILSERMNLYLLKFEDEIATTKALQTLHLKENIIYADYNYFIEYRDTVPNEISNNLFPHRHWNNAASPENDVNALEAWDFTTGGTTIGGDTIVLAVIDDGVAIQHPDLVENIWKNPEEIPGNGIDDDGNGYIDDYQGWNVSDDNGTIISGDHGTKVAGIMGAVGNNNLGVVGANWHTQLMPVCLGDSGTVAKVIKAYEYILTQRELYNSSLGTEGAYVVVSNNSFGLRGFRYASAPFWCDFFDTLGQAGIITVSAAPNEPFLIDEEGDLPTVCPSEFLITTASLNLEGEWMNSAFSKEHIDLAAPGERVSTTEVDSTYGILEGTSASSAIVSGLVGLMYAEECGHISGIAEDDAPSEGARQVRQYLLRSVDERPFLRNKTNFEGFVDYHEALLNLTRICDTCKGPNRIYVEIINDSLVFSIDDSTIDSVQWLLREEGRMDWDTLSPIPNSTLVLPTGVGCENLELSLIEYCDSIPGPRFGKISLSGFKDCQTCSNDYCTPKFTSNTSYWIDKITFEPELREVYTGNDLGYGDYSEQTFTTFYTDTPNSIVVGLINPDSVYFDAKVWLDVDHNGLFEPNEVISTSDSAFFNPLRMHLDIPYTTIPGPTRMRIGLIPTEDSTVIEPCGREYTNAIYEDYCVEIIVQDPFCPVIDSISISDRTATTLRLNVSPDMGAEEAINVRYRKTGNMEWDYKTFEDEPFELIDLDGPCVPFDVQIRRVCVFDTSAYSETQIIETECADATSYAEGKSLNLYPNPFTNALYVKDENLYGKRADIRVYDISGDLLYQSGSQLINNNESILKDAAQSFAPGVYLIEIILKEDLYTGKFIKMDQ